MASSLAFSKFAGAMVQHDGERYEVHRCEPCFFRTLAMLRRERMVNTIIDDEPIESGQQADQWSSQGKFQVVLESASLNAAELAEYCWRKGLYVEQINAWREACEQASRSVQPPETRREREEGTGREKRLKQLERELRRTAALLVYEKKPRRSEGGTRTNDQPPDRRETM